MNVNLNDLKVLLEPSAIKVNIVGNTLIAKHEHYETRLDVVPPDNLDAESDAIKAVVRIVTKLPVSLETLFKDTPFSIVTQFNQFAALGALSFHDGGIVMSSRLTIYKQEDAWRTLQLPLLAYSIMSGAEAILGAIRRTLRKEPNCLGESAWTDQNFETVKGYLSRLCVCTTGGGGLTAEFGLKDGATSALVGDHKTALFQMFSQQPHPELGGGLLNVLQMPHQVDDDIRLENVCVQLNKMEMSAHDLPPHFGAWCKGNLGNNPAYVSFYPNALHSVNGIAANVAVWALIRARWANALLPSMGVLAQ